MGREKGGIPMPTLSPSLSVHILRQDRMECGTFLVYFTFMVDNLKVNRRWVSRLWPNSQQSFTHHIHTTYTHAWSHGLPKIPHGLSNEWSTSKQGMHKWSTICCFWNVVSCFQRISWGGNTEWKFVEQVERRWSVVLTCCLSFLFSPCQLSLPNLSAQLRLLGVGKKYCRNSMLGPRGVQIAETMLFVYKSEYFPLDTQDIYEYHYLEVHFLPFPL